MGYFGESACSSENEHTWKADLRQTDVKSATYDQMQSNIVLLYEDQEDVIDSLGKKTPNDLEKIMEIDFSKCENDMSECSRCGNKLLPTYYRR